jgi:peptide/nickel transport system permease protein
VSAPAFPAAFPASLGEARRVAIGRFLRRLGSNGLAVTGIAILSLVTLAALAAPLLAPGGAPPALDARLLPPGAFHLLGTDELGRDIAARLLWGARATLATVVLAALLAPPIGLLVGCTAGLRGGAVDWLLMRVTDVFLAFPRLVLALALAASLGPGLENAALAIALTSWPAYARLARAETLAIAASDFVAAARVLGAGEARIVARHVVPLCLSAAIVRLTLEMAGIILTAAGLGFLGLGAQPPVAEWGAMVAGGRRFLAEAWWVATLPGAAILVASLGFNLLGDGLRDVLDPRRP